MIIKASEIKLGTQLAESDGYLFEVTEIIKETDKSITIRLCSDNSYIKKHWKENGGVVKTFRKASNLYGVE